MRTMKIEIYTQTERKVRDEAMGGQMDDCINMKLDEILTNKKCEKNDKIEIARSRERETELDDYEDEVCYRSSLVQQTFSLSNAWLDIFPGFAKYSRTKVALTSVLCINWS